MSDEQNRNRDMDTWGRLTVVRGESWQTGWKKVKVLRKKYTTHKHRQHCVVGRGNVGLVGVGRGGQRGRKSEQKDTFLGAMGAWCSGQLIFCWIVHWKPVWFCEAMWPH